MCRKDREKKGKTKRNATQRDWKAISLLGERTLRTGSISTGKEQAYKDIVGHVDRSLSGKGGVDVVVECSCWTCIFHLVNLQSFSLR